MSKPIKPEQPSQTYWVLSALILVGAIGLIDLLTGYEISVVLFYIIPIGLSTWVSGRPLGLAISLISTISWVSTEILTEHSYSSPGILYWNALSRLGFFVIIVMLLPALKALELERQHARIDFLTGAINRRFLFEILEKEIERAQRYNHPFSLAYLDLDNFKVINDQLGHNLGDQVLCTVVTIAKKHLRRTDAIARMGGDEFLLLLPETDQEAARFVVYKTHFLLADEMRRQRWPVTFSIGVLTCEQTPSSIDDLINQADRLMYSVKDHGKNAITYAFYEHTETGLAEQQKV